MPCTYDCLIVCRMCAAGQRYTVITSHQKQANGKNVIVIGLGNFAASLRGEKRASRLPVNRYRYIRDNDSE